MRNKFRGRNNQHLLQSLFIQKNTEGTALYSLTATDVIKEGQEYPSLRKLFIETDDPTEYTFSQLHLDGWEHWQKLQRSTFLTPYIKEWRKELDVKIKSRALASIIASSQGTSREAFAAQKYLSDGGYKPKQTGSKRKVLEVATNVTKLRDEREAKDLERLLSL